PEIINISEGHMAAPLRPEDGRPAEGYVFMRRVHSRKKRPYCVISIYLDEKVFRKSPKRFRNETVIPILHDMRNPRIAHARQTLTDRHRRSRCCEVAQNSAQFTGRGGAARVHERGRHGDLSRRSYLSRRLCAHRHGLAALTFGHPPSYRASNPRCRTLSSI